MAPASSSFPSDSRLKWKKRKRDANNSGPRKQQKPRDDEDEVEEEEEEEEPTCAAGAGEEEEDRDLISGQAYPGVDLRQCEVLSDTGQKISDFPLAFRRSVNRPHPSVLAIIAAERLTDGISRPPVPISLENISHGQLQVLSTVLPDNPALNSQEEMEKLTPAYVCTPPPLMEWKGVVKRLAKDCVLVLPQHSDWFDPSSVHRLERQVVPHFFSGKSSEQTAERYIMLRNRIVGKYLENPERKLSFGECQSLVSSNELYDLSRIVRFLDHWGIINYLAVSKHHVPRMGVSLIREESNGELQVTTSSLKSIDSLMQFDRPRSSYRLEDIPTLSSGVTRDPIFEDIDLDSRIRERLSEHACSYCSCPLVKIYYQSQKEVDAVLCLDCFHDGKFIVGHSGLDFTKMDLSKDFCDIDGESWTDQETFLLLEALEIYNDNWNEIAEHVGTKSKAQCILHFIRLPVEDGLLESIEVPHVTMPNYLKGENNSNDAAGVSNANSNGDSAVNCLLDHNSENRLPFATSRNPVMSLVAFLTAAVGPRVAAACANAALSILTKEDTSKDRMNSESMCPEGGFTRENLKPSIQNEQFLENQGHHKNDNLVSSEKVKTAAMFGLSAAAIKAKLFADQEEREIQRITATVINHQLKRLELKLKQFAEVETLLIKECEQVERTRQRLSTERVRLLSTRFGQAGTSSIPSSAPVGMSLANANSRQQGISLGGQANVTAPYGNNLPTHPHMPFMPRQQMYPFVGPRLPLSAIHPSSSPQSNNVMLASGTSNTPAPGNHHPLLRSMSSSNKNLG